MKITSDNIRRNDLDWLRVITVLAVFFFHCNLFFRFTDWHVKNHDQYLLSEIIANFMMLWIMPVIFSVSAAASVITLERKSAWTFVKDRFFRLFIPLVFGILVLAPPQVYLEKYSRNAFLGDYFSFYPHYFDGFYGFGGNFAWFGLHLWYLLILWMFSLSFLPFLMLVLRFRKRLIASAFGWCISKPLVIFLPGILIGWVNGHLDPGLGQNQRGFGGWPVQVYEIIFLFTIMLHADHRGDESMRRNRIPSLSLAGISVAALAFMWSGEYPACGSLRYAAMQGLCGFASWCFIIGLHGLFSIVFRFRNRFLDYANEAVLPFYIIHQTVIIIVGYFVVIGTLPALAKFLIIAPLSFVIVMAVYEFGVRRWRIMRFLFGMKK